MTVDAVLTAADASSFLARANARMLDVSIEADRAAWAQATHITAETEEFAADRQADKVSATMELAAEAARFERTVLPDDLARQLSLIKLAVRLPGPRAVEAQVELTRTVAALEAQFGKGRYDGRDLGELSVVMAERRDPDALLDAWRGWRTVAPPMREPFARYVALANRGARDLGFADLGALWRSGYDMAAADFAAEMDRLWLQIKPLYDALHAYTRAGLGRAYGQGAVAAGGLIPAHLLGNMWSDSWGNVYPLLATAGRAEGVDLTSLLRARDVDPVEMVRFGERFFTSLGFDPLPVSFWDRSLFTKPPDRDVMCHPTAWDIDADADLRLSMCIETTADDFMTVHHELGHHMYFRAYRDQPFLYRDGANDGFHEAIGEAITLSMTPGYLREVGLLDEEPADGQDVPLLLRTALDRVPYLAFGLALDKWRWKVFSGEVTPADYNAAWWDLARTYQRIAPPVPRSESDFDAAAKYHVAANVPVVPYCIALILQFQFHRAFARASGFTGPLHRFSVYGDRSAGEKLDAMLAMGRSRPWPEALFALTGEREMDPTALLEYFAPLQRWLEEQNSGHVVA
ncbi:MAG: M2 family metallopeptidase [Chloroflexota bacterium]